VAVQSVADARPRAWADIARWPRRRWAAAGLWSLGTVLAVGIPTVLVPNPVFGREIEPTWWAWPVLLVTAALAGLGAATYVRPVPLESRDDVSRRSVVGAFLAYLAVGCPVCNKVALLALGYSGALQWFAPVQPVLAAAGIAILLYALDRRLVGEVLCTIPQPASR